MPEYGIFSGIYTLNASIWIGIGNTESTASTLLHEMTHFILHQVLSRNTAKAYSTNDIENAKKFSDIVKTIKQHCSGTIFEPIFANYLNPKILS